jgi:hypothetical protein
MIHPRAEDIDLGTATTEEITEAMGRGVRAALLGHKLAGRSVVVWDREKDQTIILPPDQIIVPEDIASSLTDSDLDKN